MFVFLIKSWKPSLYYMYWESRFGLTPSHIALWAMDRASLCPSC